MKVLFVDSETGFREVMIQRMARREMDTVGLASGEEALAFIEKEPVDVVVMDTKMPGCRSGIDILREIKSRWPLIEVIILTGHAMLNAAREGMESGAFDYIVKPADFDELFYKIMDAGQKKKLQEAKIKNIKNIIRKQE